MSERDYEKKYLFDNPADTIEACLIILALIGLGVLVYLTGRLT
jgi:hypothetical protein